MFKLLCFCEIYRFQNLWRHYGHCYIMKDMLINAYLFWMQCTTKVKLGQILVCCMRNISYLFLAECWRLETNSRLFYFFIKLKIKQDLTIFNGWHLPFLIVPYSPFQKDDTLESWHNLLWVIEAGFSIKKNLELSPTPPTCSNDSWKLFRLTISINWPSLVT